MSMAGNNNRSTARFSDRVQNYTRYRPSYPISAIDWLIREYHLNAASGVADIGSGTGIFSDLLMSAGLSVTSIEPNDEMRMESDRLHSHNPLYTSLSGTAEATMLETDSVDIIVAAQSFHWFDSTPTKREFRRILKPNGVLALVWNKRDQSTDFQSEYESVLGTLPEYRKVKHTRLNVDDIKKFFSDDMQFSVFENGQDFNKAGFRGRVFSSSYTPSPGDVAYPEFSRTIDHLFDQYSREGMLSFSYRTEVYSGTML